MYRYNGHVYHVMIRSTPHHRTRVLYNVSLDGPFYTSLYELVEDFRQTARIEMFQICAFSVKLGRESAIQGKS